MNDHDEDHHHGLLGCLQARVCCTRQRQCRHACKLQKAPSILYVYVNYVVCFESWVRIYIQASHGVRVAGFGFGFAN